MEADAAQQQARWSSMESAADRWAAAAGLAMAPANDFVEAWALVRAASAAVAAEGPGARGAADLAAASNEKKLVLVRCAANRRLGRIEQRKNPLGAPPGLYWNVTCAALAAKPFARPNTQTNKKERRVANRVARGLPPERDPEESRRVEVADGPHFTRYTDELLQLTSAPALLELRLFPNAKELSESFACFAACRAHLAADFSPRDPGVAVLCVGDGRTPRTAALFAFRTAWRCTAVDPIMEEEGPEGRRWDEAVERLHAVRAKIQDAPVLAADRVLLVLPHAHVGLGPSLAKLRWSSALGVVAMPCCNYYKALSLPDAPPLVERDDPGVVSPHRLVRVWRWTAEDAAGLPPAVAACRAA